MQQMNGSSTKNPLLVASSASSLSLSPTLSHVASVTELLGEGGGCMASMTMNGRKLEECSDNENENDVKDNHSKQPPNNKEEDGNKEVNRRDDKDWENKKMQKKGDNKDNEYKVSPVNPVNPVNLSQKQEQPNIEEEYLIKECPTFTTQKIAAAADSRSSKTNETNETNASIHVTASSKKNDKGGLFLGQVFEDLEALQHQASSLQQSPAPASAASTTRSPRGQDEQEAPITLGLPQPLPNTDDTPSQRRRQPPSQPGAHRVVGQEVSRLDPPNSQTLMRHNNYTATTSARTGDGTSTTGTTDTDVQNHHTQTDALASARPIDEDEENNMPRAHAHAVLPSSKESDQFRQTMSSSNHHKRRVLVILVLVLIVIIMVVVVITTTKNKNNSTTPTSATLSSRDHNNTVFTQDESHSPAAHPTVSLANLVKDQIGILLPWYSLQAIQQDMIPLSQSQSQSQSSEQQQQDSNSNSTSATTKSPQYRAYQWLLEDPFLDNYTSSQKLQRFAMATMFYATQGEQWHVQEGWLSYNVSECWWQSRWNPELLPDNKLDENLNGTATIIPTVAITNNCNSKGQLEMLDMVKNNLVGTIPPELALLTSLLYLSVKDNEEIGGRPMPTELFALTNLQSLELDFCQWTGFIPTELGQLTNLKLLVLVDNAFSGTVPSELGLLSHMEQLRMSYLGGQYLSEGQRGVTGTLPLADLFGGMPNLTTLHLHGNSRLDDNVLPTEIGNLKKMERLVLGQVSFAGSTIPSEIGLLTNMFAFAMRNSSIGGSLPMEIWNLTNMQRLELDGNLLTGTVCPPEISRMAALKEIYFSYNEGAVGPIPTEIGLLSDLEKMFLHHTSISGTVPTELLLLSQLGTITFTNTLMQGSIPTHLCENVTHPGLICRPNEKGGPPNPEPAGFCVKNSSIDDNDLTSFFSKCSGTLLCGCDCGVCR